MKNKSLIKTLIKSNVLAVLLLMLLFFACESDISSGIINLSVIGTKPGTLAGGVSQPVAQNRVVVSSQNISVYSASGTEIGIIALTDARLALKEIKLKRADAPESEDSIHFPGPYVVNLLNNEISPSLDTIEVPSDVYDEIELKLDKIEGDEVDDSGLQLVENSDPLFGNSIYLNGTYTGITASGSVTSIPFTLSYDFDETFELTGTDVVEAFTVDGGDINPIIIAFRMAKWFIFNDLETNPNNVDFNLLILRSGEIILDENSGNDSDDNETIREVIKNNIEESADYGEDEDNDGELDSSEDDDPVSEDVNDD